MVYNAIFVSWPRAGLNTVSTFLYVLGLRDCGAGRGGQHAPVTARPERSIVLINRTFSFYGDLRTIVTTPLAQAGSFIINLETDSTFYSVSTYEFEDTNSEISIIYLRKIVQIVWWHIMFVSRPRKTIGWEDDQGFFFNETCFLSVFHEPNENIFEALKFNIFLKHYILYKERV